VLTSQHRKENKLLIPDVVLQNTRFHHNGTFHNYHDLPSFFQFDPEFTTSP